MSHLTISIEGEYLAENMSPSLKMVKRTLRFEYQDDMDPELWLFEFKVQLMKFYYAAKANVDRLVSRETGKLENLLLSEEWDDDLQEHWDSLHEDQKHFYMGPPPEREGWMVRGGSCGAFWVKREEAIQANMLTSHDMKRIEERLEEKE